MKTFMKYAEAAKDWETMRIGCEMMGTIADDLHGFEVAA